MCGGRQQVSALSNCIKYNILIWLDGTQTHITFNTNPSRAYKLIPRAELAKRLSDFLETDRKPPIDSNCVAEHINMPEQNTTSYDVHVPFRVKLINEILCDLG